MSTTVRDYLDEVERLFLLSPVVHSFQIREREERLHEGFIRIRAYSRTVMSWNLLSLPLPVGCPGIEDIP
jgi:hypothetical protein